MTSVEWLHNELTKIWWDVKKSRELLEQAKTMQNKELRQAWNDGYKKSQQDIVTNSFSTFEQYQNEKNG
jgi:hypothetical protein